jgi:catechol 2,3-dioxygenase-like lactoylglutathione lyase family enzyme
MKLVDGVHHLTFLSDDIDRLAAFYERVFEATKTLDMTEEGVRHVFLEVGPTTVLHPFQLLHEPDAVLEPRNPSPVRGIPLVGLIGQTPYSRARSDQGTHSRQISTFHGWQCLRL